MSEELTLVDFQQAFSDQAGAFASAWSSAGEAFTKAVIAEGGVGVISVQRQYEILAQKMAERFSELAAQSMRWANAASEARNPGVGKIMMSYADKYATQANALLDPTISAEMRIGTLAAEATVSLRAAESVLGGALGRAAGPALDAYQMAKGALEWGTTGDSKAFGQAAMGVFLSSLGAGLGGG